MKKKYIFATTCALALAATTVLGHGVAAAAAPSSPAMGGLSPGVAPAGTGGINNPNSGGGINNPNATGGINNPDAAAGAAVPAPTVPGSTVQTIPGQPGTSGTQAPGTPGNLTPPAAFPGGVPQPAPGINEPPGSSVQPNAINPPVTPVTPTPISPSTTIPPAAIPPATTIPSTTIPPQPVPATPDANGALPPP